MEKKSSISEVSTEQNKESVKTFVSIHLGTLSVFLAKNQECFPGCCKDACPLLGTAMKELHDIELEIKHGTWQDIANDKICTNHSWLEYGDMIIDPTDYQFHSIDLYDLPLTQNNITPKDISYNIGKLSEEQLYDIFQTTYLQNAKKRVDTNPNPKEQFFKDLTDMAKDDKISPDLFFYELQRCFKAKTFYSKEDKDFRYEPKDEIYFEEIKDKGISW